MFMKKYPLIDILSEKFPSKSREELIALLYCREVFVNGQVVPDPRVKVGLDSRIEIKPREFVSRGGKKLEYALREWSVEVEGKVIIDAGASTGGFTDCLLKYGARLVYSVDVGYNQIDYSLRMDSRVVVLERTNIMHLKLEEFKVTPDFAVADLSFRSIRKAATHLLGLVGEGFVLALIKPQFEWKSPPPYFRGVVKRKEDLYEILRRLVVDLFESDVAINRVLESPIRGQRGNREFFFELISGSSSNDSVKIKDADIILDELKTLVFS